MTLIKSISGIRGTIGGEVGNNLTPIDIVECTAGFGQWIIENHLPLKVVVGRDGRISGEMVSQLAIHTLTGMGIDVVDLGLSTTPTVEMIVPHVKAGAGIIFTASHNPKQWNALKFLNAKGEFISARDGQRIKDIIESKLFQFSSVDDLGTVSSFDGAIDYHINQILALNYINVDAIKAANFHVVVDCINSTGALSIPPLLEKLGVSYDLIHAEVTGDFAHNPEPLAEHLMDLSMGVVTRKADMGISVDPDVDRLAFVNEDGNMFGEEYTLVAVADYMLAQKPGNTVSNLSSTRALRDITLESGNSYKAAAVGEVNVVTMMKNTNAIIGGEGNGGIILPALHYGRDALVGIALFLGYVASQKKTLTQIKSQLPIYHMQKSKIELTGLDVDQVLSKIENVYQKEELDKTDGLKIDFEDGWVHIRKSNTEPIIRIYSEAKTAEKALQFIENIKKIVP